MAPLLSGCGVFPAVSLGEYELPAPVAIGAWIFPRQCVRHDGTPVASTQVALMNPSDFSEVLAQRLLQAGWQHGQAIDPALTISHHDLIGLEVEILDSYPETLVEA